MTSKVQLLHGDSLQLLYTLPAGSIDAVISDPPFNAGKDFDNDDLSPLDWRAFCNRFALALYHLQPKNIIVEVSKKDSVMQEEISRYFEFKYTIVLNYTNSMRNGVVGFSNFGLVLWFAGAGGKVFSRYKDRIDSQLHSTKKYFKHPSPKEVVHYAHLCRMFCQPAGVVCDPFMGSGTTGIAALVNDQHFIGIDSDAAHVQTASQRIEEVLAQQRFLQPAEDSQQQLSLLAAAGNGIGSINV